MEFKDGILPKNFTKEFKTKETFHSYFESLYKQGIEQYLFKCKLFWNFYLSLFINDIL